MLAFWCGVAVGGLGSVLALLWRQRLARRQRRMGYDWTTDPRLREDL